VRRRVGLRAFVAGGLVVAALLAVGLSRWASTEPDGLNRVAIDEGFADEETDHALADAPTAGYAVDGVEDEGLGTGLAGLIGVAVTFAVAGGLLLVVRRRSRPAGTVAPRAEDAGAAG
jgi:hypothetical protein